jgi:uncharacterized YceG family protein
VPEWETVAPPVPEPDVAPPPLPADQSEPGDETPTIRAARLSARPEVRHDPEPADTVADATAEVHADGEAGEPAGAPPAPPARPRRTVSLPRPQTGRHEEGPITQEEPIGVVRAGRPQYAAQPGAPAPGHRRLTVPPRPGGRRRRIIALLLIALLIAVVAVLAVLLFEPFHDSGQGTVRVRVPPGASADQIGDLLAQAGVVDSGFFFSLRARLSGQRSDLRAGSYTLRRDMSYAEALDRLTTPPAAAPVIDVTLPEGPSRRELAPRVRAAGVRGSYLVASRRASRLSPRDYGAPRSTATLEGFLFPATYELRRRDATARQLVARQIAAFKEAFARVDLRRARRRNLSRYDVLIIASMVEREVLVPRERRLIAGVIYNRLRQSVPLGIDATIRYARNNWSRPLRRSELEADSAYNTRLHRGLPPTPIGNPGLAAIRAAADPASTKAIYYVVKPCGNGAHSFSSTKRQFDRDVAAYNRKRKELRGRDPSTC